MTVGFEAVLGVARGVKTSSHRSSFPTQGQRLSLTAVLPTRLETRTKESDAHASRGVSRNPLAK